MATKKLIVNADDFGQSEGVNKGIIQCYEKGIVTSTSLMVRYPSAKNAADYAKNNPGLGLGLHVDLGEWTFKNNDWEPLYEVIPLNDSETVYNEIKNQLHGFFKLMKVQPTHLDSHQHVHQRRELKPIFIEIARELNIPLRGTGTLVKYCGFFYGQGEQGQPLADAISITGLETILHGIHEGITEMACHPALENDLNTMYKERDTEVRTLCNPRAKNLLQEEEIELCSFKGIPFN